VEQPAPQRPTQPQAAPQAAQIPSLDEFVTEFGEPGGKRLYAQAQQIAELRQMVERGDPRVDQINQNVAIAAASRAQQLVEGFLAKQPESIRAVYGKPGVRSRVEQAQLEEWVEGAAIYQQTKLQRGISFSEEQALQVSLDARHAAERVASARADATERISTQVRNRHRGLDVTPGAANGQQTPEGYGSKDGFLQDIRTFQGARRR